MPQNHPDDFPKSHIIVGTLLLQFALVSWTFPLTELWSDNLQAHIDAAFHWYQLKLVVNLAQTGSVVAGYDPFFAAGYPAGLNSDPSSRFPAVLAVALHPWLTEIGVYKLSSFLSAVLGPVFIPLAARRLKLSAYHSIISTIFGLILWWTSMFRWYHTAGMVTHVMASYAALWYFALVIGCLNAPGNRKLLIVSGITGAILFFYHPYFPIPIVFGTLAYLSINYKQLNLSDVIKAISIISILALVLNLFWVYPFYYSQDLFVNPTPQPFQKRVDINLIWQWTLGWNWGARLNAVLAFAALWACIGLRTSTERRLAWCFTLTGWLLVCFAALTGNVAGILSPNRFSATAYLMMIIPAAMGVLYMLSSFRQHDQGWPRKLNAITLFAVAAITVYCLNEVRREISYADIGHYGKPPPEVTVPGDYSQWIPDWLKRNTTPSGRVLFEIPVGRVYDNSNAAGYYAYTSDREFIGGPLAYEFFANFYDSWLFEKQITSIDSFDFQQYLDLYNVGWIIVHSDVSKKYLESIPQIVLMDEYKKLRAYKVNRSLDFFIEGKGVILERGHNKLLLSELEGDSVTLKYHFIPGMKSEPSATLVPVKMLDDPNPFIRIIQPPKRVLIYLP